MIFYLHYPILSAYNSINHLLHSICRLSVISCRAYIALGLGDYVNALDYSRELLAQPMLPGAYKLVPLYSIF